MRSILLALGGAVNTVNYCRYEYQGSTFEKRGECSLSPNPAFRKSGLDFLTWASMSVGRRDKNLIWDWLDDGKTLPTFARNHALVATCDDSVLQWVQVAVAALKEEFDESILPCGDWTLEERPYTSDGSRWSARIMRSDALDVSLGLPLNAVKSHSLPRQR